MMSIRPEILFRQLREMFKRRSVGTAMLLGSFLLVLACTSKVPPVNVTVDGIAIKGYDPVAYFTMGRPVQGVASLEIVWQGARWFFANPEHRELFRRDPARYAPQYGGY